MADKVWGATVGARGSSVHYFAEFDAVGVPAGSEYIILGASNGTELLRLDAGDYVYQTEQLPDDDTLLLSTGDELVAVDTRQWQVQWQSGGGQLNAISDDVVVLLDDATITCVDRASGDREWTETLYGDSVGVITVSQGTLVANPGDWDDKTLVGLDVRTGRHRWEHVEEYWDRFDGYDDGVVVQCNEHPEGSSYYSLTNINPVNGHEQWHLDEYASVLAGVHIGDLFVSHGDRFVAVNKRTGQIAWAEDYNSIDDQHWIAEHQALFVSVQDPDYGDHDLQRIEPETGTVEWHTWVDDQISTIEKIDKPGATDWVAGSRTFKQDDDSAYAYRLSSQGGYQEWGTNVPEQIHGFDTAGSPLIGIGRNDTLYAFDTDSGKLEWTFGDEYLTVTSGGSESIVISAGGDSYVIGRDDGRVQQVFSEGAVSWAERGIIHREGQHVEAYALGPDSPLGSDAEDAASDVGDTQVYASDDASPDETNVYDGGGSSTSSTTADGDTTISFCPSCGTNLDAFGSVAFCPSCGTEL